VRFCSLFEVEMSAFPSTDGLLRKGTHPGQAALGAVIILFMTISWGLCLPEALLAGEPDPRVQADDHAANMDFFEEKGNFPEAIHHGRAAAAAYLRIGEPCIAGRVLQKVSALLMANGARATAIHEIQKAIRIQTEVKDRVGLATSLGSLALLKASGPRPAEGVADYLRAVDIALSDRLSGARRVLFDAGKRFFRKLSTKGTLADSLGLLKSLANRCARAGLFDRAEGFVHLWHQTAVRGKNHDGALESADALARISKGRGYRFGELEAMKFRGLYLLGAVRGSRRENHRTAREIFLSEKAERGKLGDRVGLAWALNNLGWTHLLLEEYSKAEEPLQRASELFREFGDKEGYAKALNNLLTLARALENAELVKQSEAALKKAAELAPPKVREVTFEPQKKRLSYYMFMRVSDTHPIVRIRAYKDRVTFQDTATGEVFDAVGLRPGPVKVTISTPALVRWFDKQSGKMAQSVFYLLGERYLKYGDSLLFLADGDCVVSIRENRLVLVQGEEPAAALRDVTKRWPEPGGYPDRATPSAALATLVESLNRGVIEAGSREKPAKVNEEAWKVFLETLSEFIRPVMDRDSFVGTSEKRMGVPLRVTVKKVFEIAPWWVKVVYAYAPKTPGPEAAAKLKAQKLEGSFTAYAVLEGKEWKVDFLAGRQ
jgi:tetratricopeptide (TPR) repeat protein